VGTGGRGADGAVARMMVRRAERLADEDARCTKAQLTRAVRSSDRDYLDDALELALDKGWLVHEDGGYFPK
jgi:hypothetical protein